KGCVLTTLDYRPVVQNYGIKCFIKSARELKVSPANLFLSVDKFPDFSLYAPNIPKRIFDHRGFH
ncbi:MAG: hypothetical protein OEY73_06840, partial [Hadesarchaea archaeon]|nr:hypothetical protein [Hadesarchaea archaeon]